MNNYNIRYFSDSISNSNNNSNSNSNSNILITEDNTELIVLKKYLSDFDIESKKLIDIENSLRILLFYIHISELNKGERKTINRSIVNKFQELGLSNEQIGRIFSEIRLKMIDKEITESDIVIENIEQFIMGILTLCEEKNLNIDLDDNIFNKLRDSLKIFSRYDNSEFNDYIKEQKIILYNNIKNYLKKNTYERSVRRRIKIKSLNEKDYINYIK